MNNLLERLKLIKRGYGVISHVDKKFVPIQIIGALAGATSPFVHLFFYGKIIDELLGGKEINRLMLYVTILIISTLILTGINKLALHYRDSRNRIIWRGQEFVINEKVLNMDYEYIESSDIHNLRRGLRDISNVNNGGGIITIYYTVLELFSNFFGMLFSIVFIIKATSVGLSMASMEQKQILIPVFLIVMILLVLISFLICRNSAKGEKKQFNLTKTFYGMNRVGWYYVDEYLFDYNSGKDIRMFGQYPILKKGFDNYVATINKMNDQLMDNESRVNSRNGALSAVMGGIIYLYFGCQAWFSLLGVGSVVTYAGASIRFIQYFSQIITLFARLYISADYLKPYFDFVDIKSTKTSGNKRIDVTRDNHTIEFKNVSFQYPNTEKYVLENISVTLDTKNPMAVVGRNGSGKTTFIKLLCRLYDPTEGDILLDGSSIKEYDYESYLDFFAVVFQDFNLLSASIAQNVAAGETVERERVILCLKNVGMLERINAMEKGIDTVIYKDYDLSGVDISGGEAQKIAIARGIYKNAKFVVMDEPTAALDPIAEHEIYSHFNTLIEDKMALFISHRLSSCRFCEDIIVFDQGRIIQRGDHNKLLDQQGSMYNQMWNAQAQYYE